MKKDNLFEIGMLVIVIALCVFVVLASMAAYQDTRSSVEWRKAHIEVMKERCSK